MAVCAGLSLSSCVNKDGVWQFQATAQPTVVDSYCQVYQPVVVEKGDGSITAKTNVKKRILANELTYREQCAK